MRAPELRRCALFTAGADAAWQVRALNARPDMLIQDLEDSTPSHLRAQARSMAAGLYAEAKRRGIIAAVRVNTLESCGIDDLAAVVPAQPQVVFLPKCVSGEQVAALAAQLDLLEVRQRLPLGEIEIVPNAETAAGIVNLKEIAHASARVKSVLMATEDLASDLRAERTPQALELAYARQRFLLEARAFGVEPIDAPYTFSDEAGCAREALASRALGYRCKSAVLPEHVAAVLRVFTPSADEVALAQETVHAFEAARAAGQDRALVRGLWIEPPTYLTAKRLIERARELESLRP